MNYAGFAFCRVKKNGYSYHTMVAIHSPLSIFLAGRLLLESVRWSRFVCLFSSHCNHSIRILSAFEVGFMVLLICNTTQIISSFKSLINPNTTLKTFLAIFSWFDIIRRQRNCSVSVTYLFRLSRTMYQKSLIRLAQATSQALSWSSSQQA